MLKRENRTTQLRISVNRKSSDWQYEGLFNIVSDEPIDGLRVRLLASCLHIALKKHYTKAEGSIIIEPEPQWIERNLATSLNNFQQWIMQFELMRDKLAELSKSGLLMHTTAEGTVIPVNFELVATYDESEDYVKFDSRSEEGGRTVYQFVVVPRKLGINDYLDKLWRVAQEKVPELIAPQFRDGQLYKKWQQIKEDCPHFLSAINYDRERSIIQGHSISVLVSLASYEEAEVSITAYYPSKNIEAERKISVKRGITAVDLLRVVERRLKDPNEGIVQTSSENRLSVKLNKILTKLAQTSPESLAAEAKAIAAETPQPPAQAGAVTAETIIARLRSPEYTQTAATALSGLREKIEKQEPIEVVISNSALGNISQEEVMELVDAIKSAGIANLEVTFTDLANPQQVSNQRVFLISGADIDNFECSSPNQVRVMAVQPLSNIASLPQLILACMGLRLLEENETTSPRAAAVVNLLKELNSPITTDNLSQLLSPLKTIDSLRTVLTQIVANLPTPAAISADETQQLFEATQEAVRNI